MTIEEILTRKVQARSADGTRECETAALHQPVGTDMDTPTPNSILRSITESRNRIAELQKKRAAISEWCTGDRAKIDKQIRAEKQKLKELLQGMTKGN